VTTLAWTADELARATKIPAGVVDVALRELANAGEATEMEPGRFKAKRARTS
jgi:hypothetical protein